MATKPSSDNELEAILEEVRHRGRITLWDLAAERLLGLTERKAVCSRSA